MKSYRKVKIERKPAREFVVPMQLRTWESIVEVAPDLLRIEADAIERRPQIQAGGNTYLAYEDFKRRWSRYVGHEARDPRLMSSAAYDVVREKILNAMGGL